MSLFSAMKSINFIKSSMAFIGIHLIYWKVLTYLQMLHLRFDLDNGNDKRGALFKLSIVPIHIAYNTAHSTQIRQKQFLVIHFGSPTLTHTLTHQNYSACVLVRQHNSHMHTMVHICMYNVILIVTRLMFEFEFEFEFAWHVCVRICFLWIGVFFRSILVAYYRTECILHFKYWQWPRKRMRSYTYTHKLWAHHDLIILPR